MGAIVPLACVKGKIQAPAQRHGNLAPTPFGCWVLSPFPPNMLLILPGKCSLLAYTRLSASSGAGQVEGGPSGPEGPVRPV